LPRDDPELDTVEVLRDYRKQMKLEGDRWMLLRGEAEDVRELAAVLGFNYAASEANQIFHSNIVTVLSRRGEIVYQQVGAGGDRAELVAAIETAADSE
jgi:protein SCO1/2